MPIIIHKEVHNAAPKTSEGLVWLQAAHCGLENAHLLICLQTQSSGENVKNVPETRKTRKFLKAATLKHNV